MSAKDKAKELVDKMYSIRTGSASMISLFFAKQSALIAVDEILANAKGWGVNSNLHNDFWLEVKQEITDL